MAWGSPTAPKPSLGNLPLTRYPWCVSPREKVLLEALELAENDRLLLAREILDSLTANLSAEDEAELLDRMKEIDSGGATVNGRALIKTPENAKRSAVHRGLAKG